MTELELTLEGIKTLLFVIFIMLWYFLNGIKSNLEKIAEELKQDNTKVDKNG